MRNKSMPTVMSQLLMINRSILWYFMRSSLSQSARETRGRKCSAIVMVVSWGHCFVVILSSPKDRWKLLPHFQLSSWAAGCECLELGADLGLSLPNGFKSRFENDWAASFERNWRRLADNCFNITACSLHMPSNTLFDRLILLHKKYYSYCEENEIGLYCSPIGHVRSSPAQLLQSVDKFGKRLVRFD